MIEKRYITRCNYDDADEFFESGDYRSALNVLVVMAGKDFKVKYMKGNQSVFNGFSLPSGTNRCIGSLVDETENRIIWYNHNSNGNHGIYEYKPDTGVRIIRDSPELNFSLDHYIHSSVIFGDILSFTDNYNPPRQINISVNTGINILGEFEYEFIKRPLTFPVTIVQLENDPNIAINNLTEVNMQFTSRFVYRDGQNSVWSDDSLFCSAAYDQTLNYNKVKLSLNPLRQFFENPALKNEYRKYIRFVDIAFRETYTFPYRQIRRFDIDKDSDFNELFSGFYFDNSESYPELAQEETDRAFDSVGLLVETMDGAKNRIAQFNITEGYDQVPFVCQKVSDGYAPISWNRTVLGNYMAAKNNSNYQYGIVYKDAQGRRSSVYTTDGMKANVPADFWNLGKNGNHFGINPYVLSFQIGSNPPTWAESYEIVRTENQNCSFFIQGILNDALYISGYDEDGKPILIKQLIGETRLKVRVNGGYYEASVLGSNGKWRPVTDTRIYTGGLDFKDREIRWVFYDTLFLSDPEPTDDYFGFDFNPNINNPRIIGNEIYPGGVNQNGVLITASGSASTQNLEDAIDIWLDIYNWNNTIFLNKILQPSCRTPYVFEKGDRVNIYYLADGTYLGILSQEIKDVIEGRYLRLEFNQQFLTVPLDTGTFIEVYTPKKKNQTLIYYGTGISYPIVNGQHFNGGLHDVWVADTHLLPEVQLYADQYRINQPLDTIKYALYSMNPSSKLRSETWEKANGRPNIVNTNGDRQLKRTTLGRWSNRYVEDSKINGLSEFEEFNSIDLPNNYGPVRRVIGLDTIMLVVCENTAATMYVDQIVYTDAKGSQTVATSDNYLNVPRILDGQYGSTHPESAIRYGNDVWWFSDVKGAHVKYSSYQGTDNISMAAKFRTYFTEKGKQYLRNSLVVSGYHPTHKLQFTSFPSQTIGLLDPAKTYNGYFSFIPESYAYIGMDMYSFKDGVLYVHDQAGVGEFYGNKSQAEIELVFNEQPDLQKVYNSLRTQSNVIWSAEVSTQEGQLTQMIEQDFERIDNIYYTDILSDESQGGNRYYNGDLIASNTLRVKFIYNGNTEATLTFAELTSQLNQRTGK